MTGRLPGPFPAPLWWVARQPGGWWSLCFLCGYRDLHVSVDNADLALDDHLMTAGHVRLIDEFTHLWQGHVEGVNGC